MITSFIIILELLKDTVYSICLLYNVFFKMMIHVFRFCQNPIFFLLNFVIFDSIFKINFISTCEDDVVTIQMESPLR